MEGKIERKEPSLRSLFEKPNERNRPSVRFLKNRTKGTVPPFAF